MHSVTRIDLPSRRPKELSQTGRAAVLELAPYRPQEISRATEFLLADRAPGPLSHGERQLLMVEHQGLVKTIAIALRESVSGQTVNLQDLLSVGMKALMGAADLYDPTVGVSFQEYAKHRIRGAILDSRSDWFRQNNRHVPIDEVSPKRLPKVEDISRRYEMRDAILNLSSQKRRVLWMHYENGFTMTEIAAKLELTVGRISQIHRQAIEELRKTFCK